MFARLPRLVERAGRSADGNITAFYTVLVEGDDLQEPIADAVRGHLDGHIVLCRKLATRGHYPAIDVLESVSRTMGQVIDSPQRNAAEAVRHVLATYRQHEELVMLGAYPSGSHPGLDHAIRMQPDILRFLQQDATQPSDWQDVRRELLDLSQRCQGDTSGCRSSRQQAIPCHISRRALNERVHTRATCDVPNSKSEARNPKQVPHPKIPMPQTGRVRIP